MPLLHLSLLLRPLDAGLKILSGYPRATHLVMTGLQRGPWRVVETAPVPSGQDVLSHTVEYHSLGKGCTACCSMEGPGWGAAHRTSAAVWLCWQEASGVGSVTGGGGVG